MQLENCSLFLLSKERLSTVEALFLSMLNQNCDVP